MLSKFIIADIFAFWIFFLAWKLITSSECGYKLDKHRKNTVCSDYI